MQSTGGPHPVETIFVGGGTPTRLEADQLARLCQSIVRWFPLANGGEWTVEANPGTLTSQKAEVLAEAGVNRLSLGAQSFQPKLLEVLERHHVPDEVREASRIASAVFPRWSLDMIFGVPGSTLDDWRSDLDEALSLGPQHLSCYGLVYETGTSLWKEWSEGRVRAVDEDVERLMYEHVIDTLASSSLEMYEISNYARPGHECRHNLVYWANGSYFGVGVGAARYVVGTRSVNTRSLDAYLRRIESDRSATTATETLAPAAKARETAVLMLRRIQLGIERAEYQAATGFDFDALLGGAIERHVRSGLVEDDGLRLRFSREGVFLADLVLRDLV